MNCVTINGITFTKVATSVYDCCSFCVNDRVQNATRSTLPFTLIDHNSVQKWLHVAIHVHCVNTHNLEWTIHQFYVKRIIMFVKTSHFLHSFVYGLVDKSSHLLHICKNHYISKIINSTNKMHWCAEQNEREPTNTKVVEYKYKKESKNNNNNTQANKYEWCGCEAVDSLHPSLGNSVRSVILVKRILLLFSICCSSCITYSNTERLFCNLNFSSGDELQFTFCFSAFCTVLCCFYPNCIGFLYRV